MRRGAPTRRGGRTRRIAAALLLGSLSLLYGVKPAHAEFDSVFVYSQPPACFTDPVSGQRTCAATTWVHVVDPAQYAACVALMTEGAYSGCGEGRLDAEVYAAVIWTPGACASFAGSSFAVRGAPVWTLGAGGGSSAPPTCSTVDYSYTQTFTLAACPGTTFQVTADMKGNADETWKGSYSINSSGPCAGLFDVAVSESS